VNEVTAWSVQEVLSLDEAETHFGDTQLRVESPEYLLLVVPGSHALTVVRSFASTPVRAEDAIDEAIAHARRAGAPGLRWVISALSTPADLAERLLRRGFVQLARCETLFFVLGTPEEPHLPPVRATTLFSTREAKTVESMNTFIRLGEQIFGDAPPPPEYLGKLRAEVRRSIETTGHSELFLTYEGSKAIGRGGMSVTGKLGRLWTAGILPEHRGRGAYSHLTRARCEVALSQGAEIAITHAKVGTSEPILKRLGFQTAGPYDCYELNPS
jgi:hypothetical protein